MRIKSFIVLGLISVTPMVRAAQIESTIAASIDSTHQISNVQVSDWTKLSSYFQKSISGQIVPEVDQITENSDLEFYKKVIQAKNALLQNQSLKVLELLQILPVAPDIELSEGKSLYRTLYLTALNTKASALKNLGKSSAELDELVWALFPDYESPAGSASPPFRVSVKAYVDRLHALYVLKKWPAIASMIPDITSVNFVNLNPKDKCQVCYEWAEAQRQLKNNDLAAKGFGMVTSFTCEGETLSRSLFWKAKFEAIAKKYNEAIKTYESSIRLFPNQRYTDDAYYALKSLYESAGMPAKADQSFEKLMSLQRGDMKAKVLWEDGYAFYKKRDYSKAISKFDSILAMSATNDEYQPQALYWKARCLDQQNKSGEAKNLYGRLAREFPFSFYSVMAKHRLGLTLASMPEKNMSASSGGILSVVDELNHLGNHDQALEALDYFAQTNQERARKDIALMAAKFLDSGDYHRAMMLAHDYFGSVPSSAIFDKGSSFIAALFPLAFKDKVVEASKESGLARGVIEGIMREESLFQTEIESSAGAKGLMQLMPSTAAIQARESGVSGFSVSRLSEPGVNIKLGADFFAKMVNQFDGQIPLAIMAYNAGPGNVRKWLNSNGHLPLDEFIEEIPFSETRGYIKRVLRSIQVYGLIHNEDRLKKPFVSMKIKT